MAKSGRQSGGSQGTEGGVALFLKNERRDGYGEKKQMVNVSSLS